MSDNDRETISLEDYDRYTRRDIVKDVLITIVLIVLFFAYWAAMLLLASLILINVWHVSLERIWIYAGILTVLTSAGYVYSLVKKRRKGIH